MSDDTQNSVTMGSLYELNQQAYNGVMPLSGKELKDKLNDVVEWLYERRCSYSMLLCHERRDYTTFAYITKDKRTYSDGTINDLQECLMNRGKVLDVSYLQDNDCWEIWIRIREDGESQNYLFMFFDAEGFVIEV